MDKIFCDLCKCDITSQKLDYKRVIIGLGKKVEWPKRYDVCSNCFVVVEKVFN